MVWVYISRYRLKFSALQAWLASEFPHESIDLQQRDDDVYAVEISRGLTQAQIDEIENLRGGFTSTPLSYENLQISQDQIRLLHILPESPYRSGLECTLEVATLTPELHYLALAYVWGNSSVTHHITVNGKRFGVTENLHAALEHISTIQEDPPKPLWIDAICINQSDKEEWHRQVRLMRTIYGSAHTILAWTEPANLREFQELSELEDLIELPELSEQFQSLPYRSGDSDWQERVAPNTDHLREKKSWASSPTGKNFDVGSSGQTAASTIPTDSGYGSMSKISAMSQTAASTIPTDSGYASISKISAMSQAAPSTVPTDPDYASLPITSTKSQKVIDSDRLTIRSTVPTIEGDSDIKTALVRAFVDEISSHLSPATFHGLEQGEKLSHTVESLLKTFVETLEPIAESNSQRQGVLFLRQQRRRISRDILLGIGSTEGSIRSSGNSTPDNGTTHQGFGPDEIMNWLLDQTQGLQRVEEDKIPSGIDMSHYFEDSRAFITQSDAFRWFIDQLTATMALVGVENLSNLNHCMVTEVSRHASFKQVVSARFLIRSRLDLFLKKYFGEHVRPKLGDILVVIKNDNEHQMLTCRDYMRQTWPSSGEATLNALQSVLDVAKMEQTHEAQSSSDEITLHLQVEKERTSILIRAPKLRVCDIGVQICWLSAACQSPEEHEWFLSSVVLMPCGFSRDDEYCCDEPATLFFEIQIEKERIAPLDQSNDGCWQGLLNCANIVMGFPIAHRMSQHEGMEIPLEIMAQLAGARRVTTFDGRIVLKGFASLLVAVECDYLSTTWHYIESTELSRLSFSAANSFAKEQEFDLSCLKAKRHFLGWTRYASQETGTSGASYVNIRRSRSETVFGPRFALSGINLSVSKYVSGGANFTLSERANSLRLKREGPFEKKVYSLSRMYAVLYDDQSQRGWLIDGASAVLHALRCQLAMPPYDQSRLFDLSSFRYSGDCGGPIASMEALLNIGFRRTKVFESRSEVGEGPTDDVKVTEKVTYWTIESMIEDLWDVFEQMYDHQEKLKSAPGVELRFDRETLEGWSFVDLLSEPVLQARSVKLTPSGRGWVDFTRTIQAVTLLARDFGEIIKPMHHDRNCHIWAQVPHDMDYLAVRLQLIKQICEVYGDPTSNPLKLANGIYWHRGHQLFEDCSCLANIPGERCDRVQVLLPELTLGRKTHPDINLEDHSDLRDAAIIFGRSARWPWTWPNKEHPKESSLSSGSGASDDSRGSTVGNQSPFSTPASEQSSRSSQSVHLRWPFGRRKQKRGPGKS